MLGGLVYEFSVGSQQKESIRIGICADIDNTIGKGIWQAAILAAEQVNAEGGVLGRKLEVVAQDDDTESSGDVSTASNALTRLITADKADFVIAATGSTSVPFAYQDISAEHKKILFSVVWPTDNLTQRVIENYERYKYYFRAGPPNSTSTAATWLDPILTLRNYTGFNKVAILSQESIPTKQVAAFLNSTLPANGFQIVYTSNVAMSVTDFTSYFAAIEESGAEILFPQIFTQACIPFIKEYCDRQSPFLIWGFLGSGSDSNFWNLTEGKCKYVSSNGLPTIAGYPFTNKTLPSGEAYLRRWGERIPNGPTINTYDAVRFLLPDAIKRAGTIETEAVIKALEKTAIETSTARRFSFTSSHDVMMRTPLGLDYPSMMFQWQNGDQVPVYPEQQMLEAGATFKYPFWNGPWTK